MRGIVAVAALSVLLIGCVSTGMKKLVGQPIEEAFISYGQPENVFAFPDGRRVYQFRWGGGAFVQPSRTNATVTAVGNTAVLNSTTTPAAILNAPGCLITFITTNNGNGWIITDYRIPKQLVC